MRTVIVILAAAALVAACQLSPDRPPVETVDDLDLDRFMGDWYVIANIPTPPEKGASASSVNKPASKEERLSYSLHPKVRYEASLP